VTLLNDQLFVVRSNDAVEAFNSKTFRFMRKIPVRDLRDPADMTSCAQNKCLYISDKTSLDVFKVDPPLADRDTCQSLKWPVGETPRGLSVTSKYNVLVTCVTLAKLKEFTPTGVLQREIRLTPDPGEGPVITYPWHAIELSDSRFVVCHGEPDDQRTRRLAHCVCIVDKDGKVDHFYGGMRIPDLNGPGHLAVDDDGFVFVADTYNNRVLLLSPTLKFARIILSPSLVRHPVSRAFAPVRLCLDSSDARRLFVADVKRLIVASV
jgi:hypothetical protein